MTYDENYMLWTVLSSFSSKSVQKLRLRGILNTI